MPRRRDPVPRASSAGHWLSGILLLGLLGGGVVVAAALLWENLDLRQLAPGLEPDPAPLPRPERPPRPGYEARSFGAVILHSARNQAFFPDTKYYGGSLRRWRALVEATGGAVREVGSAEELEGVAPEEVLVIPDAPCLSDAELKAVRAHAARGGAVVTNWAVGARDERCAWRGWNNVAELTGAADVRELAVREALYLTVPGGTPFSAGLDPGTRVELVSEPSLAVRRTGPRVYWSDWALNPAPDESGGGADVAALTYRGSSGGRGVWFGFRLSQSATPADSASLDQLVGNGLRWAAGIASFNVAPWPDGLRAALLLAQNVEADYGSSATMAELLRRRGVRGSFYAVSQLVLDDADLAGVLTGAGEVGTQTSDHQPVGGLPLHDQSVRLRRSWVEVRGWTGVAPRGLRPPEERFDEGTLQAWRDVGGSYIVAVNQARSGSPEVYGVKGGAIVLLPRLVKDDYNVVVQDGAMRTERLTTSFLEGVDKMRAVGGIAVVASHTQIMGVGERLRAIETVIDSARAQKDWWIAPGEDIASWWKARSGVRLTTLDPGEMDAASGAELGVLVEASPDTAVRGLWVDVVLPENPGGLGPLVDGESVAYVGTPWGIRVPVGDIEAGGRRVVSLVPTS